MAASRRAEVDTAIESLDFDKNQYAIELTTSKGQIRIEMYPDRAPGHCQNMLGLAKIGFYDGVTFHRVIPDFVIQGGCPEGNGTGGPGYTIDAEFNDMPHEVGVLSMARTSDPNSAGSQFFLCLGRVPHLDNQYTVFGAAEDESSKAVILEIGSVATDGQDRPLDAVTIERAVVVESPR